MRVRSFRVLLQGLVFSGFHGFGVLGLGSFGSSLRSRGGCGLGSWCPPLKILAITIIVKNNSSSNNDDNNNSSSNSNTSNTCNNSGNHNNDNIKK